MIDITGDFNMSDYKLGQEFVGIYPPEAAIFATQNGYKIVEEGTRGSKTVYKIVEVKRSKEDLISVVKSTFKNLSKDDADASIIVKLGDNDIRVNANTISLRRDEFLLEDFDDNSTMGKLVFITYDNNTVLINKDELSKIVKGIKKFQLFLVQKKADLLASIESMTKSELETFNIENAFKFEF